MARMWQSVSVTRALRGGGQFSLHRRGSRSVLPASFRLCLSSSSSSSNPNPRNQDDTIVIVGGGPTGLFMAQLLQSYNVNFVLLEAQKPEQRFQHPQAHFLNTRTMEILKHVATLHQQADGENSTNVYQRIRDAMPPVEEWKSFLFGPDMMLTKETCMAKVVHPVDRPLMANTDANGKLVAFGEDCKFMSTASDNSNVPLSEVSVGHLAQHTFCRILYDAVMEREEQTNATNKILYGHRVVECNFDDATRKWTVQTDKGEAIVSSILVAADGARSFLRSQVLNIPMSGQAIIQNLMNVHFQVSPEMEARIPKAMLYTVFSSQVLAMIVRHGFGDYVMQIPYFAPYQTPEEDFRMEKVQDMVRVALGSSDDTTHNDGASFAIRSVRPWTMGSLVSQDYFSNKGVFLVGDAAHVFPPAGGFGMNTGLQDVFSLAWRLAMLTKSQGKPRSVLEIGSLYQQERQPVARENAALSVRNYQRVLGIMEACYLNHQHPAALIAALDASAAFVPLAARQQTFRTLLQAALVPLGQLKTSPDGLVASRVKNNLQELLGSGQGLPLLFPKHELDFSYTGDEDSSEYEKNESDWTEDSCASSSRLAIGALFPHVPALVSDDILKRFPRLLPPDEPQHSERSQFWNISTRDLALQLSTPESPYAFCLLQICSLSLYQEHGNSSDLSRIRRELEDEIGVPFLPAKVVVGDFENLQSTDNDNPQNSDEGATILIDQSHWDALTLPNDISATLPGSSLFVILRPDGHMAAISPQDNDCYKLLLKDMLRSVARIR